VSPGVDAIDFKGVLFYLRGSRTSRRPRRVSPGVDAVDVRGVVQRHVALLIPLASFSSSECSDRVRTVVNGFGLGGRA